MIAEEYAKAIYGLSTRDELREIDEELNTLLQALEENPDGLKILTYPNISQNDKKDIIKNITKGMNPLVTRFLYVLIDNERFEYLEDIYNEFHKSVSNEENTLEVNLYSKALLTESQIDSFTKTLSSKFQNRKIKIKNIVDSKLIGGVKAVADGECIDLSLRAKIDQLKATL